MSLMDQQHQSDRVCWMSALCLKAAVTWCQTNGRDVEIGAALHERQRPSASRVSLVSGSTRPRSRKAPGRPPADHGRGSRRFQPDHAGRGTIHSHGSQGWRIYLGEELADRAKPVAA